MPAAFRLAVFAQSGRSAPEQLTEAVEQSDNADHKNNERNDHRNLSPNSADDSARVVVRENAGTGQRGAVNSYLVNRTVVEGASLRAQHKRRGRVSNRGVSHGPRPIHTVDIEFDRRAGLGYSDVMPASRNRDR